MEKQKLVLTIDVGTQSCRCGLFNKKGEIIDIAKTAYKPAYFSIKNGYAEQDPDFYFKTFLKTLKQLVSKNKNILDQIIGASLTTFRDSSVQLDQNFKPLRNTILWLDQRTAECKEPLPFFNNLLFSLVGMKDTIQLNRKRTVANWLIENEPEIWAKTAKYVNISTYLTYKLTGNLVDSCSSMTGHYPMHFKKRCWYKDNALKGSFYNIPSRMRPKLVLPGTTLGVISDEICDLTGLPKGISLIATGSDKACETIGLGALSKDIGAISYGTASTIEVSNKRYHEPERFLPAYPAATNDYYNMEVQVYRGYWMLTWFSKQFASELIDEAKIQNTVVENLLDKDLKKVPPGSDGLVLQPYWGPGLSRPTSKGSVVGFTDIHTRGHLYRAIIEGIAYALKEGLESIERSQKHKIKQLMISGGGSQSEAICQITADIFGLSVTKVQTYETTSLGAAISTFHALGEFNTIQDAISHMSHKTRTFKPNKEAHKKYRFLYNRVYLKLYPRLKHIYKSCDFYRKKFQ